MSVAVIGIGTNLGDRAGTVGSALAAIRAVAGIGAVRASTIVETVAVTAEGLDDSRPRYLNAVAIVETTLSPHDLLAALHRIEAQHGRIRTVRFANRTLDLDIEDYDGVRLADERLVLPHPRAHERDFVLRPWLELDPDAVVPGRGRVDELLAALERRQAVEHEVGAGVDTDFSSEPDGGTR